MNKNFEGVCIFIDNKVKQSLSQLLRQSEGRVINFALFYLSKINFCAKSQPKNYSTENKVIGAIYIVQNDVALSETLK